MQLKVADSMLVISKLASESHIFKSFAQQKA